MKLRSQTITLLLAVTLPIFGLWKGQANAFSLLQNDNRSQLLDNFLGDTSGLSNFDIQLIGDSRAFGSFTDDPFNLGKGIVLSTGRVIALEGRNGADGGIVPSGTDLSTDFGSRGIAGDSISMRIDFDADDTKDSLFFRYVFGSEEFVEYAGKFNDSFSLSLNGKNLAYLPNGKLVSVNNLASSPLDRSSPYFIYNPVGSGPSSDQTKLDGYTMALIFQGALQKNARNSLLINVADARDGFLDSAVFLQAYSFGTSLPPAIPGKPSASGKTVPEPSSILGSLCALGTFSRMYCLKRRRNKISKIDGVSRY
jgi:hypothetical protein